VPPSAREAPRSPLQSRDDFLPAPWEMIFPFFPPFPWADFLVVSSPRCAYRRVSSAFPFVPVSVESYGRLGAPALTLLGDLADQAVQAGEPGLSRAATGELRELTCVSVGRAGTSRLGPLAGPRCAVLLALGQGGLYLFCALCVGFGFLDRLRFVLRSLAMCHVCEVALLLFLAGWPFLPSLSV
jgi:hypothetical protein